MPFTPFGPSASATGTGPFQFSVATYGAKGDGQMVGDGATDGTTGQIICATSQPFKSTDVGKWLIVNGALGAGNALVGTITSFQSASQVTINAASNTVTSGACVLWGSDDTSAFQQTINAACQYMNTKKLSAQVYKPQPNGLFHMIAGPLVTTGTANGQLVIPTLYTVGDPQQTLYFSADLTRSLPLWTQSVYAQVSNSIVSTGLFTSTANYVTNANTFGKAGVISSTPSQTSLVANIGGLPAFQNIHVVFQNWTIVCPSSNNGWQYSAFQMGGSSKVEFTDCAALLSTNYNTNAGANKFPSATALQNGLATGFILSGNGNNDDAIAFNPTTSGYAFGVQCGEHAMVYGGRGIANWAGFRISGADTVPNGHCVTITGHSLEQCPTAFYVVGQGQSGVGCFVDATLDCENILANSVLLDNNSGLGVGSLYGTIKINGNTPLTSFPPLWPVLAKLIKVGSTTPGWVFGYTGFSTAGTGVAIQNPYWRQARVVVSGGTVTAISVGATNGGVGGSATTAPAMTATGLTAGTFDWPPGGWMSITQTVNPTVNVFVEAA